MSDKLFDFHVQMKIHELHDIKSADLAKMIRIGLAVMQSDYLSPPRVILTKGVNHIETAGRGGDKWDNPEFGIVTNSKVSKDKKSKTNPCDA